MDCGAGVAESNSTGGFLTSAENGNVSCWAYIIGPTLNLMSSAFTYCHLREIQHYYCFQVAFWLMSCDKTNEYSNDKNMFLLKRYKINLFLK